MRQRAGAAALSLIATPVTSQALKSLEAASLGLTDLGSRCGCPLTTLRDRLRELVALGAVAQRRRNAFPGTMAYELTVAGQELLPVIDALEHWLDEAPGGPRPLGGTSAKASVKALTGGWSTTLIRALAARPLSLLELDSLIAGVNYPTLERRLSAMRISGLVQARSTSERAIPYALTDWLRRGILPLMAAARWERMHLKGSGSPLAAMDFEALFLLVAPLLEVPDDSSGSVRLGAETNGRDQRLAGAIMVVDDGSLRSCTTRLDTHVDAWALGAVPAWLRAILDGDVDSLELGGDGHLARSLVNAIHDALAAERGVRELAGVHQMS